MKATLRAGLSLMEVILAIAILGGSLTVVGQLVRIGARNAIEARDLAAAQLLCEAKLNEVAAGVEIPDAIKDTPIDETGEWLYSIEVVPSDLEGMLAVNVTVSQDPQVVSRPLTTTLSRWMVDPEYATAAAEEEAAIKQAFTDAKAVATGPMSGTTKGQVAMASGAALKLKPAGDRADVARVVAARADVARMAEWMAVAAAVLAMAAACETVADALAMAVPEEDRAVEEARVAVRVDKAAGRVVRAQAVRAQVGEARAGEAAVPVVAKAAQAKADLDQADKAADPVVRAQADKAQAGEAAVLVVVKAAKAAKADLDRADKAAVATAALEEMAEPMVAAALAETVVVETVVVETVGMRAEAMQVAATPVEGAAVVPKGRSSPQSRGVTLLELILALSLSIFVLMAISMAVNLFFKLLDVRRTNVEETRIASAVLKHIATDLRGVVQYTPPDLSGLESLTSSLASSGLGAVAAAVTGQATGGSGSSGGQASAGGGLVSTGTQGGAASAGAQPASGQSSAGGGQSTGGASASGAAPGATAATGTGASQTGGTTTDTTATTEEEKPAVVSFRGSSMELRFDVSRLPRVDQYAAVPVADGSSNDLEFPSDIKTVVYFLQNDDNGQAVVQAELGGKVGFAEPSTSGRGRGLMRSEQDRAVLTLAESSGDDTAIYNNATLLAAEVVGLAFQYFDGTEWLTDWDSSTQGGLPRAVEIVVTLQPTYALTEKDLLATSAATSAEIPEYTFRQVVNLPSAPLVAPAAETEESTSTTATGSSTSSSSGSGSSQSQGAMP